MAIFCFKIFLFGLKIRGGLNSTLEALILRHFKLIFYLFFFQLNFAVSPTCLAYTRYGSENENRNRLNRSMHLKRKNKVK